jgi:hypothetical protein
MRVVSNTSPISNLAIIGRLELLRERYGRIVIPPAVQEELSALSHPEGKARVTAAINDGWLVVESLPDEARQLEFSVQADSGETEAIQLAHHTKADKILLDDSLARAAARESGLGVAGLLGELVFAKQNGRISSVREEIHALRTRARFFVSAAVEATILAAVGE